MQDATLPVLRDIHEFGAVSWWPPAAGWWLLVGLFLLVVLGIALLAWLRHSGRMPGWRRDARRQLHALHRALRKEPPREIAGHLSILLRRVAMVRGGRRNTASLSGDNWLGWLEANDSTGFRWTARGRLLLTAPYMPPDSSIERREVTRLIVAARRWVNTITPADRRQLLHWRIPQLGRGGRGNV